MVKYGTSSQLGLIAENHKEKFPEDWKYAEEARSRYVDNMMSKQYAERKTTYDYSQSQNIGSEDNSNYQIIQKWESKIIKESTKKGKGAHKKQYIKNHIVYVRGLFENILDMEVNLSELDNRI